MDKELKTFDEITSYLLEEEIARERNFSDFKSRYINPTKEAMEYAKGVVDIEYQNISYGEKNLEKLLDEVERVRKSIKRSKSNINRCNTLITYYDIIQKHN